MKPDVFVFLSTLIVIVCAYFMWSNMKLEQECKYSYHMMTFVPDTLNLDGICQPAMPMKCFPELTCESMESLNKTLHTQLSRLNNMCESIKVNNNYKKHISESQVTPSRKTIHGISRDQKRLKERIQQTHYIIDKLLQQITHLQAVC